jgi:arylsulfatase A-like enzyme
LLNRTSVSHAPLYRQTSGSSRSRSRPFFLVLGPHVPHWPHYASETFAGKSANGAYGDCIEEVNWSVGQILAKLKDFDMDNRTLVLFTSR